MTVIISGRQINEGRIAAGSPSGEAEGNGGIQSTAEGASQSRRDKFPVVEIFGPTIQGEGAMLGVQTMFVRFGGCDYRCTKCDSLHSVLPELVKKNSVYMSAEEIVAATHTSSKKALWVTLSGGNPAIHDLQDVVRGFRDVRMKIAVETQGTIWRPWLLGCDHVTISPKGPGMGEEFEPEKFDVFVKHLYASTIVPWSVKFVIMNAIDLEFAKSVIMRWQEPLRGRVYLSLGNPFPPLIEGDTGIYTYKGKPIDDIRLPLLEEYAQTVDVILEDDFFREHKCKITPQLHVLFWGNKQGV